MNPSLCTRTRVRNPIARLMHPPTRDALPLLTSTLFPTLVCAPQEAEEAAATLVGGTPGEAFPAPPPDANPNAPEVARGRVFVVPPRDWKRRREASGATPEAARAETALAEKPPDTQQV